MCMADDGAMGDNRQEGEEGEDISPAQEETTMASPLWPTTDIEEDNLGTAATEDDFRIGYLQISDQPPNQSAVAEQEEEDEALLCPSVTGSLTGATNGHGGCLAGAIVSYDRNPLQRLVTVNGKQFYVYGNLSGLELLGSNPIREMDLDMADSEEEEEEDHRRAAVERAIVEANEADSARRSAPISPEHRTRIVNAMKGINLGGFRPSWADSVSEDQWMNKIKGSSSASK